jgi:hypothetical protein
MSPLTGLGARLEHRGYKHLAPPGLSEQALNAGTPEG